MEKKFDFSGWATKANIKCSDGRVITEAAFKHCDGKKVPLLWGHQHDDPNRVLGHALLEYRNGLGMYAYCKLNETEQGQNAKIIVEHGDVVALSIYANQLAQNGPNVMHGDIKEVSLVLAGANPGAFIENVIRHSDDGEAYVNADEGVFKIYDPEEHLELYHSEDTNKDDSKEKETVADEKKPGEDKTVKAVWENIEKKLDKEELDLVYGIIGSVADGGDESDDDDDIKHNDESKGGNETMKKNVFDAETEAGTLVLSHADQQGILIDAKKSSVGTFQGALQIYAQENALAHEDVAEVASASGFTQNTAVTGNITALYPEYHDVKPGAPELLTNDQGWIGTVMAKVHKSPFSRIRTGYVDIRNIEGRMDALRAKGYKKGNKKGIVGNYELVRRTTDPQTIYVKHALHKDDITDITDFDIVQYQYNIDRMQLNEELATAIMFGDGRAPGADGKIEEDKIRPIWKDDELYTLHYDLDLTKARQELNGTGTGVSFGENYVTAEAMINTVLYAREKFKGTGTPDMYITPHMLNVMLLARDMNGRRIYSSKSELEAALNVGTIHTVEQMEGKTRTDSKNKVKKIIALIVNLADYSLGATKGGQVTHFTQFDIDFNQQKSLLETRCSGALTKVYSALAIEEDVTPAVSEPEEESEG